MFTIKNKIIAFVLTFFLLPSFLGAMDQKHQETSKYNATLAQPKPRPLYMAFSGMNLGSPASAAAAAAAGANVGGSVTPPPSEGVKYPESMKKLRVERKKAQKQKDEQAAETFARAYKFFVGLGRTEIRGMTPQQFQAHHRNFSDAYNQLLKLAPAMNPRGKAAFHRHLMNDFPSIHCFALFNALSK